MSGVKSKFPVIKGKRRNYFPSKPLCPVCGKKKVWEPHSMASISAGALLLLDKREDYWGPSEDMNGYLYLNWHGAHDGGEGKYREMYLSFDIARDVKSGQFDLHFCSTKCLRSFLNECVDELEDKIDENIKANKKKKSKRLTKKKS
jgi:hypothetical protein